jgi:hypothetical protein
MSASGGRLLKQHTDGAALEESDDREDEIEERDEEKDDALELSAIHRSNPVLESEHVSPAVAHITSACVCDTVSLKLKQHGLLPVVSSQTLPLRIG